MMKPVTVAVDVPLQRVAIYDFLDVLGNHEAFTDHALTNWRLSGPARGVGAKVQVTAKAMGRSDEVEIEVVEAEPHRMIRERNIGARGHRVAHGTYELTDLPAGGTRIQFTYAWTAAPLGEQLLAPIVRAAVRQLNQRSLERLTGCLLQDGVRRLGAQ